MWGSSESLRFFLPGVMGATTEVAKREQAKPISKVCGKKRPKETASQPINGTRSLLHDADDISVAAALSRDGIHVENLQPSDQRPLVGCLSEFTELSVDVSSTLCIPHRTTTPIQRCAIPLGLEGYNILGLAPTGSGKTLAYSVPALAMARRAKACCLVLLPTRVLAMQVHIVVRDLLGGEGTSIPTMLCVGGQGDDTAQQEAMASFLQHALIKGTTAVLMATPGRLHTLLKKKGPLRASLRAFLSERLSVLVLDEVDRLYDMGSTEHLLTVMSHIQSSVQRLYFSATLPTPLERDLVDAVFRERAVKVAVGTTHVPCESITQQFVLVKSDAHRDATLAAILQRCLSESGTSKVIVFCGSVESTKHVAATMRLPSTAPTLRSTCRVLHSDVPQEERVATFHSFYEDPTVRVLLATDVASRGLDVSGVDCVVNYRFPRSLVDYIHRAGRTGRAGREGVVCSLLGQDDHRIVPELVAMLEAQSVDLPSDLLNICEQQRQKKRAKV